MVYDAPRRTDVICFLRNDLSPGRTIWAQPRTGMTNRLGGPQMQESPRVDPMGEWVAWTIYSGGIPHIAVKNWHELSTQTPDILGDQYQGAYVCDWTEQGDLLANVSADGVNWKLVITHPRGRVEPGTAVVRAPGRRGGGLLAEIHAPVKGKKAGMEDSGWRMETGQACRDDCDSSSSLCSSSSSILHPRVEFLPAGGFNFAHAVGSRAGADRPDEDPAERAGGGAARGRAPLGRDQGRCVWIGSGAGGRGAEGVVEGFCVFALEEAERIDLWGQTGKGAITLGPPSSLDPRRWRAAM